MSRPRSLPFVLTIAALSSYATRSSAHDGPIGHTHGSTIAKAAREMAGAADNLWASLTPEQKLKAGFEFTDPLRYDWHFIPRPRKGLPLKEMTGEQKALAHGLLASGMSQSGYIKAETIISLEQILASIEKGKGPVRDPELYFFNIFGKPGSTDPKQPWGWRVEGHHLALNFTIVGDKGIAGGPTFMGTNPAEVRDGPREGLRVLGEEEELARKLVKSLNDDQRKKGDRPGGGPQGHPLARPAQGQAARTRRHPPPRARCRAERAAELDHRPLCRTTPPRAGRGRPGQDPQGGRRQDRLRLGGRPGTRPAPLLPHPGADLPDRIRQHPEQRQPRPQRLARFRGRFRRRPAQEALRIGLDRAWPLEVTDPPASPCLSAGPRRHLPAAR